MKNKVWIIIAVAFVAIMILAAVLYPKLSEKYSTDEKQNNASSENVVQADDFTVYDSEMNKVKLSDYFGKPIVSWAEISNAPETSQHRNGWHPNGFDMVF